MTNGNLMNDLLERVRDRRGLDNLAAQKALKRYLDEISDTQFAFDITRVEDVNNLRYLLAAGMSRERQGILADYKEEVR